MSTNSTDPNRDDSKKKRKNKKAMRNEEKKRSLASIEAESKLAKMRYYWIFNIVWTLMGCLGMREEEVVDEHHATSLVEPPKRRF